MKAAFLAVGNAGTSRRLFIAPLLTSGVEFAIFVEMRKALIKAFLRLFSALPLGVQYFNAHIVAWIARCIVHYRTKVVWDNISHAFPEKSEKERKRIYKDFYLHFGQIVCEAIWFGGSSGERVRRSHIGELVNPEEFRRLQSAAPNGSVILYAHCGNWEILGGFPFYNYKTDEVFLDEKTGIVVYKALHDPVWDEIFEDNRLHPLNNPDHSFYIESANFLRHIISHKKENRFYVFGTDQWPYGNAKSWTIVRFMHRKTRTMDAAATIARKMHLGISYLSIKRREGGKKYSYELKTIADDAATMSVQQIMDSYYSHIEEDIYADPGDYLWSHRRWHNTEDTNEDS